MPFLPLNLPDRMDLKLIIESILFNSQKPLTPSELCSFLASAAEQEGVSEAQPFKKTKMADLEPVLRELELEHAQAQRSFRLACVAGAWQFVSTPEYAPWLRALFGEKPRPPRLSQAALETLAIVAYRQPLTRAEIEQIRGVSVDGVMQTLVERGLVEAVGRAEVVGRPMTYGTTMAFLEYFGLRDLESLPAADELRRIEVKKPEALQTVEAAQATPASAPAEPSLPSGGSESVPASQAPPQEAAATPSSQEAGAAPPAAQDSPPPPDDQSQHASL